MKYAVYIKAIRVILTDVKNVADENLAELSRLTGSKLRPQHSLLNVYMLEFVLTRLVDDDAGRHLGSKKRSNGTTHLTLSVVAKLHVAYFENIVAGISD